MATVDEILAAADRAEKAGDAPAAKVLRDRAAQMQGPSPDVIQAAADRAKAAGDQAAYDALVARLPAAPAPAATGPVTPARADSEDPAAKDARLVAMFETANPKLAGRYKTAAELPKIGETIPGANARERYTVQPWQNVKSDTFGDTAATLMEGPVAGMQAFGGGLVGGESPSRSYLKDQGVPGVLAAPLGVVGDIGGAALSGLGAGIAGAIGLGTELVPGQGKQAEQKLGEDLTGMTMFAVPELAGASSIIGKAATGTVKVPQIGTKSWRNAYGVSEAKPTVESLRAAKNEAYKAVDEAGESFDIPEMGALRDKVKAELDAGNYVTGVDKQTDAVVSLLDRKAGEKMSIGQLDKLRQEFYKRLAAAPNEVGIEDAIDAIDEMIAAKADTNELMQAARLSNARYKKAETLDLAFQKAKDQTAATGSGGNILNKMRQAVVSIIDNPKRARWYAKDEIDAMRAFVEGSAGQNAMRLFGKLSPNGNGLMMALNLGAAGGTGGLSLIGSAAATGAKALADRAAIKGADALIGKVSGAAKREAPAQTAKGQPVTVPIPLAPSGGQAATSDYETLWQRYAR